MLLLAVFLAALELSGLAGALEAVEAGALPAVDAGYDMALAFSSTRGSFAWCQRPILRGRGGLYTL